jgi:hypothetical protein
LRETGSAGFHPIGGYKRRGLADEQQWMLLRLEECPHLTVRDLAVKLVESDFGSAPTRYGRGLSVILCAESVSFIRP